MAEFLGDLQLKFLPKFQKQYKKLHPALRQKFEKQLTLLLKDSRHPSLKARKMSGTEDYEARLDKHNRFVYGITNEEIQFYSIGPHDEGLGKK